MLSSVPSAPISQTALHIDTYPPIYVHDAAATAAVAHHRMTVFGRLAVVRAYRTFTIIIMISIGHSISNGLGWTGGSESRTGRRGEPKIDIPRCTR